MCLWRMMSEKWQSRSFLPFYPQRILILSITHEWKCLCGNPRVQQKNFRTLLGKKFQDRCIREEEEEFDFTCIRPPREHSSVPKETCLACDLSRKGKWEHMSEHPPCPALWNGAKEAYFFLAPSRILRGRERMEKQQPRFLKGIRGTQILLLLRVHQETYLWAMQQAPTVAHVSHPRIPLPRGWLPVHALQGSECKPLQTVKLTQIWGIGRKHTSLSIQHSSRENKQEAVKTCPGFVGKAMTEFLKQREKKLLNTKKFSKKFS